MSSTALHTQQRHHKRPCGRFWNTHNAPQAYHNPDSDVNWIHNAIKTAKQHERESAKHQREQREQREQKKEQRKASAIRNANGNRNGNTGDPLRVWMDAVDAVDEMVIAPNA